MIEPSLLVDEKKCRRNIKKMVDKAAANNLQLRPHFKTHQSHHIGSWYRNMGVDKITVSSLKMAEYFAADNWRDITVSFPLNVLEIERINKVAGKVSLNLLVDSPEAIEKVAGKIKSKVGFFIEIDCGYRRTGLDPGNLDTIEKILALLDKNRDFEFKGFLTHAGHSYKAAGDREKILSVHRETKDGMIPLKERYISRYPDLVISDGDTPTFSVAGDFTGIDEVRPGNMVFYDLAQNFIGSCDKDEIAIAMGCPVVAKYPHRDEIVVYGGGEHFSKDYSFLPDGTKHYGKVATPVTDGWDAGETGMYVKSLSHDHGIIHAGKEKAEKLSIGDIIYILPVHACLTAASMRSYILLSGERIERL